MAEQLYTVVSYDPGDTTGWAVFAIKLRAMQEHHRKILSNIAWWKSGQFIGDENSQADEMVALAMAWDDSHIVVEDFLLRKFSTDRSLLSPVRITARFEYGLYLAEDTRTIVLQPGELAMSTITDARLEAINQLGIFSATIGQPHARDAVRHALTWLRRAKSLIAMNAATRSK